MRFQTSFVLIDIHKITAYCVNITYIPIICFYELNIGNSLKNTALNGGYIKGLLQPF